MNDIQFLRNVVYKQNDYEVQTCDVYLPKTNKEGYPVVVFLHGGSFHTGSKEMYSEWGEFLAKNDIAAISVNYSLATPTKPSYNLVLDDVKDVIKFIVNNSSTWNIDTYNIALVGDSAGGYLASLGALKLSGSSFKIKACIPVYGVFDLSEWDNYTDQMRTDKVVKKFLGCTQELNPEIYDEMNILKMVKYAVIDPHFHTKFLVIYGKKDNVVLYEKQSLKFIEKLNKYSVVNKVIAIENHGHFWFTPINENKLLELDPTNEVCYQVLEFLNDCFKEKYMYDIHLYEV